MPCASITRIRIALISLLLVDLVPSSRELRDIHLRSPAHHRQFDGSGSRSWGHVPGVCQLAGTPEPDVIVGGGEIESAGGVGEMVDGSAGGAG